MNFLKQRRANQTTLPQTQKMFLILFLAGANVVYAQTNLEHIHHQADCAFSTGYVLHSPYFDFLGKWGNYCSSERKSLRPKEAMACQVVDTTPLMVAIIHQAANLNAFVSSLDERRKMATEEEMATQDKKTKFLEETEKIINEKEAALEKTYEDISRALRVISEVIQQASRLCNPPFFYLFAFSDEFACKAKGNMGELFVLFQKTRNSIGTILSETIPMNRNYFSLVKSYESYVPKSSLPNILRLQKQPLGNQIDELEKGFGFLWEKMAPPGCE